MKNKAMMALFFHFKFFIYNNGNYLFSTEQVIFVQSRQCCIAKSKAAFADFAFFMIYLIRIIFKTLLCIPCLALVTTPQINL